MNANEPWKRVSTAMMALFLAAGAVVIFGFCVWFLHDAAKAVVPFGGHTLRLGRDYVWANRVAVLFLILSCVLLAHTTARATQQVCRVRSSE